LALSKLNALQSDETLIARAEIVTSKKVHSVEVVTRRLTLKQQVVQQVYDPLAIELCQNDVQLLRGVSRKEKGIIVK